MLDRGGVRLRRADAAGVVGGAATSRIKLGTSICQLSARTPTAMAMAAITLDHLSGGRFILGLGASGPQVVEGWYGDAVPPSRSPARASTSRSCGRSLARESPSTYDGEHYQLPFPGGTGLGQAAEVDHAPAARGPPDLPRGRRAEERRAHRRDRRRLARASSTRHASTASTATALAEGFARPSARRHAPDDFEVACTVPVIIHDDVEAAADFYRPMLALYIGGMGAREVNFHNDVFARMGYEAEAKQIQDLYLEGKKEEAAAAVPTPARRGHRAHRAQGEDPRRPRAVARVGGHHDARLRRRPTAANDGRARAVTLGRVDFESAPERRDSTTRTRASAAGPVLTRRRPASSEPHREGGHDARPLPLSLNALDHRVQSGDEPRAGRRVQRDHRRARARSAAREEVWRAGSRQPGSGS